MRIALLGDMAFFGRMSIKSNPHATEYFSLVGQYLKDFDYVIGNLETPFSVNMTPYGAKSAYICSDVENVTLLKQLHVKAVCLANNHMFDFGKEGYETTKRVLKENNIDFFGTEGKELKLEILGNRIALNGFCCYSSNPLQCVPYGEYGVNSYNLGKVVQLMKQRDEQGYLNIISVHAGDEHVNYPSIIHIRAARYLADVCPYVYYGHHPHVIQGIENYKGSLIAYSLGNFCFDDVYTERSKEPLVRLTENNRTGEILELEIDNSKVVRTNVNYVYFGKEEIIKILDTLDAVKEYDISLTKFDEDILKYSSIRNSIITTRISERKSQRDLSWYLKRLRPRYAILLLNGKRNLKKFKTNVISYLNN